MEDGFESPAFASPRDVYQATTETVNYPQSAQLQDTQKPAYSFISAVQPKTASNRIISEKRTLKTRLRFPDYTDYHIDTAIRLSSNQLDGKRLDADPKKKTRVLNLSLIEQNTSFGQYPSFRSSTAGGKGHQDPETEVPDPKVDYSFETKNCVSNYATSKARKESFGINHELLTRAANNREPNNLSKSKSTSLIQMKQERGELENFDSAEPQKQVIKQVQAEFNAPDDLRNKFTQKQERKIGYEPESEKYLIKRTRLDRYLHFDTSSSCLKESIAENNPKYQRTPLKAENKYADNDKLHQARDRQNETQNKENSEPTAIRQPYSHRPSSPFRRVHSRFIDLIESSKIEPTWSQREIPEKDNSNFLTLEKKNNPTNDSFTDNSILVKRVEALKQDIIESKQSFTEQLQGLNKILQQRTSTLYSMTSNNIQVEKQENKKEDSLFRPSSTKKHAIEKPIDQIITTDFKCYESGSYNNDSLPPESFSKRNTGADGLTEQLSFISNIRLQPPLMRPKSNPRIGPSQERKEDSNRRSGSNFHSNLGFRNNDTLIPKNYVISRANNASTQDLRALRLLTNNSGYFPGNLDDDSSQSLRNATEPTHFDSACSSNHQFEYEANPNKSAAYFRHFNTKRERLAFPVDNYANKSSRDFLGVSYKESPLSIGNSGRASRGLRNSNSSYRFLINKEDNNDGGMPNVPEATNRTSQSFKMQGSTNLQEPSENIRKIEEILRQFRSHIQ